MSSIEEKYHEVLGPSGRYKTYDIAVKQTRLPKLLKQELWHDVQVKLVN